MIVAHHEVLFLAQGTASVGLAGWAATLAARWYAITNRRRGSRRHDTSFDDEGELPT